MRTAGEGAPLTALVAFITGGGGHIGAAVSTVMARQGASVIVADVDGGRAAAHAATLVDDGLSGFAVEVDVASERSVADAFRAGAGRFGGVDVLVNNAAPAPIIAQDAPVLDVALETWDAIHDVVVRGALLCARQALPMLLERSGGAVINISSVHAHAGDPVLTSYPVAKAALVGLTRTIATQYGRAGVRCNSISLGTIPYPTMSEQARRSRIRHQLLDRAGLPADAASLVAYLASPAASFVTGIDIAADGGLLAHLPSYGDGETRSTTEARGRSAPRPPR